MITSFEKQELTILQTMTLSAGCIKCKSHSRRPKKSIQIRKKHEDLKT